MFKYRSLLLFILVVYGLTAVTYALATPPLESSDEYKHYPVVQYLQTNGRLPVLDPDNPGLWLQEGAQAPLYYYFAAALTFWIDTADLAEVHQVNAHAYIGYIHQVGNKNLILHDPERLAFPWRGSILAIYLIRFASILLGMGTIGLTFALGRLLFNEQIGLLAAALTAFNPMFLFISAAVNNDSLATLLGALGCYLLVRLWQGQMAQPDDRLLWRYYLLLGLVLGLGILTKLSLGGLLGLSGLAMAIMAWQRGNWRILFVGGIATLALATAVSGWWFVRNWLLYGDLTALNVFIAVQGTRLNPISLRDWYHEFGTFYRSFWGLFGGVNVAAPQIFYYVANGLAVVGGFGFLVWLRQRPFPVRPGLWLLFAWGGIIFVLLLRWTVIYYSFQGRLLFPALAAINVVWAVGLLALVPARWRVGWGYVLAAGWLAAAVILPWQTIRPAYAFPEPLTAVPQSAQFGPISFHDDEGEIWLVGVDLAADQAVIPGGREPIRLTLYWQAVAPVRENYISAVHLLGRDLASVGDINRHPAMGMIPTSRWRPGEIWRDVYHIYPRWGAAADVPLFIYATLYDVAAAQELPAVAPDGRPLTMLTVGRAALTASGEPPPTAVAEPAPPEAQLVPDDLTPIGAVVGWEAELVGYRLVAGMFAAGETAVFDLAWRASAPLSGDYDSFVYLTDAAGERVVEISRPLLADGRATSAWLLGELVVDSYRVTIPADLPAGEYQLWTGLFNPQTGQRLPVDWDVDGRYLLLTISTAD